MNYEGTLIYSEEVIRKAVYIFWKRSLGIKYILALSLMAGGLLLKIMQGNTSWFTGALASFLLMGLAFMLVIYLSHYRRSIGIFRQMNPAQASLHVEEKNFTISSNIGSVTLQWSSIKELWQLPEFWLILYSKNQFSTLPLTGLSREMQDFILKCTQENGGKVIT